MKRFVLSMMVLLLAGGVLFAQGAKAAVQYPVKPIELVVPFAAGGGTDAVGRAIAASLKEILKQEVVVSNKTGGGGSVGMIDGLNAKPDGYTLIVFTREVVSLPLLGQAPFKTMDFKFLGNLNIDPPVVVVQATSKYKTIKDLLDDMKANPDKLKFAASVIPNYYGIQLAMTTGLKFVTVPFNGAAPALTEVLGGRGDFAIVGPGEARAQVEAGNLRPLAVMAEGRIAGLYKDVPTFREAGLDIVSGTYRGIAASPALPEAIAKILEDALAKVAVDPAFVQFMNKAYLGIGYKNSAEITKFVQKDMEILKPIIELAK
jgi:tripartite-type tricarboxylate transporter receptor subunit TctC